MLSWEELEEKEAKPVKAETQAKPAPQPRGRKSIGTLQVRLGVAKILRWVC